VIRSIPIFPLHTVLFPGSLLPLRIFEARYIDMVSKCLQSNSGFGVCLITRGREVGAPAQHARTGTYARIVDWQQGSDGLLQITAHGEQSLRVIDTAVCPDGLVEGRVELLTPEPGIPVPREFQHLVEAFERIGAVAGSWDSSRVNPAQDAVVLGYCLSGVLPFPPELKQRLLEADGCLRRLELLSELLREAGLTTVQQ